MFYRHINSYIDSQITSRNHKFIQSKVGLKCYETNIKSNKYINLSDVAARWR